MLERRIQIPPPRLRPILLNPQFWYAVDKVVDLSMPCAVLRAALCSFQLVILFERVGLGAIGIVGGGKSQNQK